MDTTGEYTIGDTTERSLPDPLAVPEIETDDTDVIARPRHFPRPSSMYPMVSFEDGDDEGVATEPGYRERPTPLR